MVLAYAVYLARMSKKKKYYVVWDGVDPGVYDSWADCQAQIKGYRGARYMAFEDREEAFAAFHAGPAYQRPKAAEKARPAAGQGEKPVLASISVDAACGGNPGLLEYQGVLTHNGEQLFHKKFSLGTNNIGEFLAIVHALALLKKQGKNTPVYSDSQIAIGWVRRKKCGSKLARDARTEYLFQLVERAEKWLRENDYDNPVLKWDTENWGEIPADFGRKR
jgi:ribonuclease HI